MESIVAEIVSVLPPSQSVVKDTLAGAERTNLNIEQDPVGPKANRSSGQIPAAFDAAPVAKTRLLWPEAGTRDVMSGAVFQALAPGNGSDPVAVKLTEVGSVATNPVT